MSCMQEHLGLMAMRTVIFRAMTKCENGEERSTVLADVKTAFLCGDARSRCSLRCHLRILCQHLDVRYVGKLERAMYGPRDALMILQ